MSKIQDDNKWYSFFKHFVDYHTDRGFKRFRITGWDNIPKNSACIFGVNHSNALMDAMVLLAAGPKKKVFIARADIFKKPSTAKILTWFRILPIYRIRDGIKTVRDNNAEIIDKAADVIRDEVPLFLFPEATHRTMHSLRQLSKGIFHIALEANNQFGKEKQVYIVPTGIEYGDYFRYRSTALISFGKPINVTEFVAQHPTENEAFIMNGLREILTERLAELISYIPDNEDYGAIWEITKIVSGLPPVSLVKRRDRNKKVIQKILKFKEKEPDKAKYLFEKVNEFTKHRIEKKISVTSIAKKTPLYRTAWKTLMILIGLPFFIASAAVTSPIWLTAYMILKGLKDKAFRNTVNYGVEFVLQPIIMIVGITLLFCLTPWEWAVGGTIFLHFSYVYFFDYCEYLRKWMSDLRWTFNGRLRKEFNALDLKAFEVKMMEK